MFQVTETSIVIAASHADATARIVENHDRCDDQIEGEQPSEFVRIRLPDAVVVEGQNRVRARFREAHRIRSPEDRQKNSFIGVPCARDYGSRIDFIPGREVAGDSACGAVSAAIQKPSRDYRRTLFPLPVGQRTARLFCVCPQFRVSQRKRTISHPRRPVIRYSLVLGNGQPSSQTTPPRRAGSQWKERGASRLCRHRPSLSNQSNRWGQPWQQQAFRCCGPAQMLPTDHDPESVI